MIAFALLTIGAVLTAAAAGWRILKREYLSLLQELSLSQSWEEDGEALWGREEEGS